MKLHLPWGKPKNNYLVLALFILACEGAGILGSIFTFSSIPTWYATLNKPFFSPPNWLFGPVWTLLYAAIGTSAYLVWRKYGFGKKAKMFWQAFAVQLALNLIWSPIFFGARQIGTAFIVIFVMWFFIYRTILTGQKLDKQAAYLLYPYLAWVSFASLLNFSVYILN